MRKTELLAPAKDKQTAFIAINSGCDAVYIGCSDFGARKNASNSIEDIREIVEYAHKFYVKVYVTVNTIISDEELDRAFKLIEALYAMKVDAIIIQDMAIIEAMINHKIPPIELHASTQCDIRNYDKVKFFENTGLSRVVLAREMTLDQIKHICENTDIEIETFIHGALCVSYSGQCYMSCFNGGRSANRGECAQSCRKRYSLVDDKGNILLKDKYLLSLKDFNASEHLNELVDFGVKSFKIEGRLKDENYVRNVVAYYRTTLDKISTKTSSGKVFLDFEPNLSKSFNRNFTDYFLNGRCCCFNFDTPKSVGEKLGKISEIKNDYFKINLRRGLVVNPQDGLCFFDGNEFNGCLVNKVLDGKIYPNSMPDIKIGDVIYRNFDSEFEKRLSKSKTKRRIGVDFEFKEGILHVTDEDNNEVSECIDFRELPKDADKMTKNFISQLSKTGESDFYVRNIKVDDYLPFMPISEINNLRRVILDKLMIERLENYETSVQKPLKYAKYPLDKIDYKGNIHNNLAKEFYEKCGCEILQKSFESSKPKDAELMRTKHCLKFALGMCKSPDKLFLVDDKGKKYPLIFDCKNCEMVVKS